MRFVPTLIVAAAVLGFAPDVEAGDINKRQHLDPKAQLKVLGVLAKTYKDGKPPAGSTVVQGDVVETGCRGIAIGVVTDSKAARNLREQVTVVTGDVINAPGRHCRR